MRIESHILTRDTPYHAMITLVQSDPEVPAGTITEWLHINDIPYRIIRAFSGEMLPPPDVSKAVIVLGGSMGVHDDGRFPFLSTVKIFIRETAGLNIPFLGICLGGQLLADTVGAHVHSNRYGEKGVHSVNLLDLAETDPIFNGIPQVFPAFQWHEDSFELPQGAVLLASSDACANQAFRYGGSMYGLQFHPEVTREIVTSWTQSLGDKANSIRYMEEYVLEEERYLAVSRILFENFLRIAQLIS